MSSKKSKFLFWAITAFLLLSSSLACWWLLNATGGLAESGERLQPLIAEATIYDNLTAELESFQTRLAELEQEAALEDSQSEKVEALRRRLEEMQELAEKLEIQQSREEAMFDMASRTASQSLEAASGMMSFASLLFTIVLFGVALITGLHVHNAREDLSKVREAADQNKSDLDQNRSDFEKLVEDLGRRIKVYEDNLTEEWGRVEGDLDDSRTRLINLESVASHKVKRLATFLDNMVDIHSSAVADLLEGFARPGRASSLRVQRLLLKGQELKGRLLLLHPDDDRKKDGVLLLSAVGTRISKVDLARLQKDSDTTKEMALLIEQSLRTIEAREEKSEGEQEDEDGEEPLE